MISAQIELLYQDGISEVLYTDSTRLLTGSRIVIKTLFKGSTPSTSDIIIDTLVGSIWRISSNPKKITNNTYDLDSLYLLNSDDFDPEILSLGASYLYSAGSTGHALVTPIDNKLSTNWSSQLAPNTVRIALQYNAAQGGVKVINKDSTNTIITSESKIILDLSDDVKFLQTSATNPPLSLTLPDYTHFNAGHTIEFFDAASKFDTKNVQISAATNQRINMSSTTPILLDITYSTIKFIYSGDSTIGWVF